MDTEYKKAFQNEVSVEGKSPMEVYLNSNIDERQSIFHEYLQKRKGLAESTVNQYVRYHLIEQSVLGVIKKDSDKDNLYEVTDILMIEKIKNDCAKLPVNFARKNVYTAAIGNYKDFINFLETDDAYRFIGEDISVQADTQKKLNEKNIQQIPFSIKTIITHIESTGLLYDSTLIKRFAFSLMAKQFLILSGLAGSGKTQLAIAFASALIEDDSQMCIVPVGADWTNREPLLGFPNALKEGEYVKPDNGVLDLLINASIPENASKPFFLILDEMNMSYVERYFADFLSAMESHKEIPLWGGSTGVPSSVALPKNLFIIGTINVDETTYMFSPKVLDRANVIEFKVSCDEMDKFLDEAPNVDVSRVNGTAADMAEDFVRKAVESVDISKDANDVLKNFFKQLKTVNAEFGYRTATEIGRFLSMSKDDLGLDMAVDCAIVQKLLPKLHGSRKKLEPVLQALWKECFDKDNKDLVMSRDNVQKAKYPLTADKIQRMHDAAQINGFTSFAEA